MNGDKIILDLCGGSGTWSNPYKEAGYDVRLITLPKEDVTRYLPPYPVYGILAAHPCTMFSLARTRAKTPRNFALGMEKAVRDWSTRPKEGFKVLDKISLKEILDKFIACATNREEISQAIFQTFGVPALPSVEEIDKAIDKVCIAYNVLNLSNANGTVNTIQQALSDAIIAAFQKARGGK